MGIQDVATAVASRMAGVPVLVGKKYLAQQGAPPRVVFVPTRDRLGPPQRIGGPSPAILTRHAGVQVHVWADDVAATEQLVGQLLLAINAAIAEDFDTLSIAPSGYKAVDGGWLDQAWTNAGEVWVGNFEFAFPVTKSAAPTAVVNSIPQTNQLETSTNPPTWEDAG